MKLKVITFIGLALIFGGLVAPGKVDAAITKTDLTSGANGTDATSFNTASVSPGSNRLVIACIAARRTNTNVTIPEFTVTGNGLTWEMVVTRTTNLVSTTDRSRVSCFRAMGTPSAGAITIANTATLNDIAWSVFEFDGVDTTGSNGSGAIVTSSEKSNEDDGGAATTISTTLNAYADAANRGVYALGRFANVNVDITSNNNWTEIHDTNQGAATAAEEQTGWSNTTTDTTPGGSWTTGVDAAIVAFEVKAAATNPILDQIHYRWRNDNGSETGASYAAAEDTAITQGFNKGDKMRLRFLIKNTGGIATSYNYLLEHSSSSCSVWMAVPTTDVENGTHWVMEPAQVSNLSLTSDSSGLTNPGGLTFRDGYFMSTTNQSSTFSLDQNYFTELEYSLRATQSATPGTTYCFRVTNAGVTTYFTYTVTPQITIATTNPRSGGINAGGEGSGTGAVVTGGNHGGGGSGSQSGGSGSGGNAGGEQDPGGSGSQGGGGQGGGGGDLGYSYGSYLDGSQFAQNPRVGEPAVAGAYIDVSQNNEVQEIISLLGSVLYAVLMLLK